MAAADKGDEYLFKVLVVGEVAGGKTSLVRRYVYNNFSENYQTTIGADFALKIIRCEDGNVIRLQLWDIAGQERFGNMTRVYFKGAVGAIVVHDINKKGENCFDAPKRWKKELDEHVGVAGKAATGTGVPTVLLANKCDMLGDRAIPTEALDKVAKESAFFRWFETSAKTGHNVDAAITALVEQVMHNQGVTAAAGDSYKVVKLGEGGAADSGGGGCC